MGIVNIISSLFLGSGILISSSIFPEVKDYNEQKMPDRPALTKLPFAFSQSGKTYLYFATGDQETWGNCQSGDV
jgi:hypothetical protein